jgi:hypothetical protein
MNRIHTKTALYETEHMWLCAAMVSLVAITALYMYFLSASVVYVVMRKDVDKEIAALGSTLSELETEFIEAQHAVSVDIASMQGFKHTDAKIFIDRTDTTLVLSTN